MQRRMKRTALVAAGALFIVCLALSVERAYRRPVDMGKAAGPSFESSISSPSIPSEPSEDPSHKDTNRLSAMRVPQAFSDSPLTKTAKLQLSIRSYEGIPQSRFLVLVYAQNMSRPKMIQSNDQGICYLAALEVGPALLRGLLGGESQINLEPGLNVAELALPKVQPLCIRVVDEGDLPIPEANIHVQDQYDAHLSDCIGRTDSFGRCELPFIAERRKVFVTKDGFEQSPAIPLSTSFIEAPRALKVVLLAGGYAVDGIVKAANTGQVLSGCSITVLGTRNREVILANSKKVVLGPSGSRATVTNSQGQFSLNGLCAPPLRVEVSAPEFANKMLMIDRPEVGGDSHLVIMLDPGVDLDGLILDSSGTPVNMVLISIKSVSEGRASIASGRSNRSGEFHFAGLAAGQYVIKLKASAGRAAEQRVGIPFSKKLVIRLPEPTPASGHLLSKNGDALVGWNIGWSAGQLDPEDHVFPEITTVTDAEGSFWLPNQCGADGRVYAWPPEPVTMPVAVMARSGNSYVDMRLAQYEKQACTLVLKAPHTASNHFLDVKILCRQTGLAAIIAVDPSREARCQGLQEGAFELFIQANESGWRDFGAVYCNSHEVQTIVLPLDDEINSLPRAR